MKSLDRNSANSWLQFLVFAIFTALASTGYAGESTLSKVQYFPLGSPQNFGIGFLSDNKTLYVGGCRTLNVELGEFDKQCRYPKNTRWGHVSIDGSLLLATAVKPGTKIATSYQIDALTGAVRSSRPGIHFSPPISIHPNNQIWAASHAGKADSASETVSVIDKNWKKLKAGVYAGSSRLFALQFSPDGKWLIANGGGAADGSVLNTETWEATTITQEVKKLEGILAWSPNGRLGFKIAEKTGYVIDLESRKVLAQIDIDMTTEEPQAAFSPDGKWLAAKGYHVFNGERRYSVGVVSVP